MTEDPVLVKNAKNIFQPSGKGWELMKRMNRKEWSENYTLFFFLYYFRFFFFFLSYTNQVLILLQDVLSNVVLTWSNILLLCQNNQVNGITLYLLFTEHMGMAEEKFRSNKAQKLTLFLALAMFAEETISKEVQLMKGVCLISIK